MLVHGFYVSQFTQLYDRNKKHQILWRPFVGSYEGEKGKLFLKGKSINLEK